VKTLCVRIGFLVFGLVVMLSDRAAAQVTYQSKYLPVSIEMPSGYEVAEHRFPHGPNGVPSVLIELSLTTSPEVAEITISADQFAASEFVDQWKADKMSSGAGFTETTVGGLEAAERSFSFEGDSLVAGTETLVAAELNGYRFAAFSGNERTYRDLLDSVTFGTTPSGAPQVAAAPAASVDVIYLVPADRPIRSDYQTVLDKANRHLQAWFATATSNGTTYDTGPATVRPLITLHPAAWYSTNRSGADRQYWFWRNVINDGNAVAAGSFNDPGHRFIYYIDSDRDCDQVTGATDGIAVMPKDDLRGLNNGEQPARCGPGNDPTCRWVGGMGHEVGHALTLPHPPGCDDVPQQGCDYGAIMWAGLYAYPNTYLRQSDKAALASGGFFGSHSLEAPPNYGCALPAATAPSQAPVPLKPIGKVEGKRPTFTWGSVPRGVDYRLIVKRKSDGVVLIDKWVSGNSLAAPLDLPFNTYSWTLRARNSWGTGPISAAVDVQTIQPFTTPPSEAPTPSAPAGCIPGAQPTFTWGAVARAVNYKLHLADESGQLTLLATQSTSLALGVPLSEGIHRWRVLASNGKGEGPYSAWTTFKASCTANVAPVARPGGPYTGFEGLGLMLDGGASSDLEGPIVRYAWDLGDNETAVGVQAVHAFQTVGTYPVTLTVTDANGADHSATTSVTIQPFSHVPVAEINGPYTAHPLESIQISTSGTFDPDGDLLTHSYSYGDGTSGSGYIDHKYQSVGTYALAFTVTDPGGLSSTDSTTVYVTPEPPAEPVVWSNLVKVTSQAPVLTKTSGATSGYDAGASSTRAIGPGLDGWIKFDIQGQTSGYEKTVGLSHLPTPTNAADIDFGLQFGADGTLKVVESGVVVWQSLIKYSTHCIRYNSVLNRVEYAMVGEPSPRPGAAWYPHGSVFYVSSQPITLPLYMDVSLKTLNGKIGNAEIAGSLQ
jgi:hypothetical protein